MFNNLTFFTLLTFPITSFTIPIISRFEPVPQYLLSSIGSVSLKQFPSLPDPFHSQFLKVIKIYIYCIHTIFFGKFMCIVCLPEMCGRHGGKEYLFVKRVNGGVYPFCPSFHCQSICCCYVEFFYIIWKSIPVIIYIDLLILQTAGNYIYIYHTCYGNVR